MFCSEKCATPRLSRSSTFSPSNPSKHEPEIISARISLSNAGVRRRKLAKSRSSKLAWSKSVQEVELWNEDEKQDENTSASFETNTDENRFSYLTEHSNFPSSSHNVPQSTNTSNKNYLDDLRMECSRSISSPNFSTLKSNIYFPKDCSPISELIKTEVDYIERLQICIRVYLRHFQTLSSLSQLVEERKIFGNIEEIYKFHSRTFLNELLQNAINPSKCFILWSRDLKSLYSNYLQNKEQNNKILSSPDVVEQFSKIRQERGLELCYDLSSLLIAPLQRITRYQLLLKELLKNSSSPNLVKEALDVVSQIPKLANDRLHLRKLYVPNEAENRGEFLMQDVFRLTETKKVFKKERVLKAFLFEFVIVLAKKEIISKKSVYSTKDLLWLSDLELADSSVSDCSTFALQRRNHCDVLWMFRAETPEIRSRWLVCLRQLFRKRRCLMENDSQNSNVPPGPRTGQHAPLRRALATNALRTSQPNPQELLASISTDELFAAHPLLFSNTDSFSGGAPSLADSCYSSSSEVASHASLSREPSDSASSTGGQQIFPYNACSPQNRTDGDCFDTLLNFTVKLGYTRENLETVFRKLGTIDVGQDRILSELVKIGRQNSSNTETHQPNLIRNPQKAALRPIVIDGSNIAMTHGHKEIFSCQGIRECVNFFVQRGHKEIIVFVPQFRRENPRPDAPIIDQKVLLELEAEQRLVWTPSRRISGRRVVCHDDRYIVKTAAEKQAIIVSNDEYRDIIKECPKYRETIEQRLLMYSFVDGKFMPPDDPLGRNGPSLDQFLCFDHARPTNSQLCPYAKKCTYGNKCKYYHPERVNGPRMSATDRLIRESINNKKTVLSTRPSMIYENCVGQRRNHFFDVDGSQMRSSFATSAVSHNNIGRTQSLNLPLKVQNQNDQCLTPRASDIDDTTPKFCDPAIGYFPYPPPFSADEINRTNQQYSSPTFTHQPITSRHSDAGSPWLLPPARHLHPHLNRNISAPISKIDESCHNNQYSTSPPGLDRQKLQYHLSQLFPETIVAAVMQSHPMESDPQKLCQRILAFQNGFKE
ncbi:zc3h12a-like ribonuclease NYN domain-containing protein [Ditylenchus destructor]|nr:zc3h12a-like ribonuclease NYN domain-containing protein [Ditylenchus destructor]